MPRLRFWRQYVTLELLTPAQKSPLLCACVYVGVDAYMRQDRSPEWLNFIWMQSGQDAPL